MAEKHPLTTEGEPTTYADWPTLIQRAMDDVSRIVRPRSKSSKPASGRLSMRKFPTR